jgi:two-component system, cell cycle sensor histidine kinase and response regulator CckA
LTVQTSNVRMTELEAAKRPPMPAGNYVLLSVSDSGHGMDLETKSRIFEPFFTTKAIGKGTGLGLATVYGIVKQSGGFIWVESSPGQGTTFEIYLPGSGRPVAGVVTENKSNAVPGGSETILVVEDETGVRELASEFLKAGGYTVLEASDGEEAMKLASNYSQKIHILLTDMVMPRMSGTDLAEKLWIARPDLRVVFMTGYAEFPTNKTANLMNNAEVLQKPFSRLDLLEKMRLAMSAFRSHHLGETRVGGPT